jgi:hypothetical protein
MGQMAVCCQNLTLDALNSRSTLSLLVGALFKKFDLFLNTVVRHSEHGKSLKSRTVFFYQKYRHNKPWSLYWTQNCLLLHAANG